MISQKIGHRKASLKIIDKKNVQIPGSDYTNLYAAMIRILHSCQKNFNISISDYPNEQLVEISWKEIDNSNLKQRR